MTRPDFFSTITQMLIFIAAVGRTKVIWRSPNVVSLTVTVLQTKTLLCTFGTGVNFTIGEL